MFIKSYLFTRFHNQWIMGAADPTANSTGTHLKKKKLVYK